MKHICILLIRFYQKFLSPLKRNPCCRFSPTCSAYALEAFQNRGFFVGFGLSFWRVLRCNPYGKGGYDPVPERKRRKHKKIPKYDTDGAKNSNGTAAPDNDSAANN